MACTYAVAKKGDEHMGKKKAARSVPAQIVIGSAAELGFMLALTAVMAALTLGGAIGQGSIRTAALCANALAAFLEVFLRRRGFAAAASDDVAQRGRVFTFAAAREPAVCGRSADGRIGGLFAAHWRGNPGGAARQPEAEDEAQTMMQESFANGKGVN